MIDRISPIAVLATAAAVLVVAPDASAFDWVAVGNPGNEANPATGKGAVAEEFRLTRGEITNSQYADFLNAVAASDPLGLYNPDMGAALGGIQRGGVPGSHAYAPISGREQLPVNYVSWLDAARFANWLHQGQPSGAVDLNRGAYDLSQLGSPPDTLRSPGARYYLPSEDEWHKAAFYQPSAQGGDADSYWQYATGSNDAPFSEQPVSPNTPDNANVANYFNDDLLPNGYNDGYALTGAATTPINAAQALAPVGSYTTATNFYGVADLAGNVWEWGETLLGPGDARGYYGGGWDSTSFALAATNQFFGDSPTAESAGVGFRIAAAPLIPGDYNDDGSVDSRDYTVWRDTFGSTTNLAADGDLNGNVDDGDYDVWVANFGSTSIVAAAIPEPGAGTIALLGAALTARCSRRSCRG